ncbi:alanine--tRNA ligase [Flavobacteriaceae bacterium]|uniref:alanine--tRNA ligase n=1 Tax=Candidatus Arcticimaribacter forsetii TaxID=2820661 RepID=UPI0020774A46|nr:alanine--tRNA ligase [Candidatus Arcticimaribacter forsetii]MDB2325831.1 alanine--tRNA ligase [Flavobacteriaceae bacterium]MDB2329669.1 alanine--tRNA ligase [Flavobacteriaceae bacterium]MDB2345822.1 alanine--tRNA ligase [Flavobacteriaceae bacterium]
MKSAEVRQQFLDFFASKTHKIVPSAPMVVKNDPTLMFTNAGMNQFKEYFLGNSIPKDVRVADTQKCLRVSGKHNDLEEVGIDTYHHTFFEMLGNWSFGDYFKEDAIAWAWELLVDVYKIDPSILYVTIFEGHDGDGLAKDTEAYDFWKKIIPEDRILLGNKADNFWEMGDQGPCGPCSEIHVDMRSAEEKKAISGASLVNMDHPQVVEVWNLVFIEFNRKADGSLEKLPAQHIDTGMGFERLCMVLQNKTSNYDTDVFTPLINEIEQKTKLVYGKEEVIDRAMRVIADHVRTVFFAIADGQLPSNTGAGYVIRRILRRAIRYGYTFLNLKDPFIFELVDRLEVQMGAVFPELKTQKELAKNVIREEEVSFLKTLNQGLILLDDLISKTKGNTLGGEQVFELYDTYGFPVDLTALIAREKGFEVDEIGFEKAMEAQKSRSRAASSSSAEDWTEVNEVSIEGFVGYDHLEQTVKLVRYRKINSAKSGEQFQLVFNSTPFYPEGGGQVGDSGTLTNSDGEVIFIEDTKKENNLIVHYTKSLPEKLNNSFVAKVNSEERFRSECNHSATHLMHQALRSILGTHVEQKGSMVQGANLRFDFSHFAKLTSEEIKAIEVFVNARINESINLEENRSVPVAEAMESGAMALFGEKYGDSVRTIRFGESIELCGGTHVNNTADIWYFKIVSESAVASGIRRIEAITGEAVQGFFEAQETKLNQINECLKHPQDPIKAIHSLQVENAALKKELEKLSKLQVQAVKQDLQAKIQVVNGVDFLAAEVDLSAPAIKDLSFELGQNKDNAFLVLVTQKGGKPVISCYISKELVAARSLNAGAIVKELGKHIQGGGGGQPFFATAGGKNTEGIPAAIAAAASFF